MFTVDAIRNIMAQYAMGLSHGDAKQDRNVNRAADGDFYQEGYDDALSGRRTDLATQHCLHVGRKDQSEDISFARRQLLHAFRVIAGNAENMQKAINAIYVRGADIMGDRAAFFRREPACALVRGEEPIAPFTPPTIQAPSPPPPTIEAPNAPPATLHGLSREEKEPVVARHFKPAPVPSEGDE